MIENGFKDIIENDDESISKSSTSDRLSPIKGNRKRQAYKNKELS
jgi:hypothetical protein